VHDQDLEVAKKLLGGDAVAFQQFFDGYFPRLYRFILRRTAGDGDSARDIVQAALIKGVRKLDAYRGEASLYTWLCQIARRELLDQVAKAATERRRIVRLEEDPSVRATLESMDWATESDPDALLQRADVAELVHAALDYLPSKYARLLELKYVQELPVDDIAANMGLTAISVQSLLARARSAFREACHALSDGLEDFGLAADTLSDRGPSR
jgi:RNA polymerase sigma-70 factor (ECF subfamily)